MRRYSLNIIKHECSTERTIPRETNEREGEKEKKRDNKMFVCLWYENMNCHRLLCDNVMLSLLRFYYHKIFYQSMFSMLHVRVFVFIYLGC